LAFWFRRSGDARTAAPAVPRVELPPESVTPTRALAKFLTAVAQRDGPVIVDCGPVIGTNVSFFGERLGCKLYIEDLVADVERHARERRREDLPAFFETRFAQPDESVDGILCWDLFDFLDRAAATALAARLARMVRRGGAVFGYFGASAAELTYYTKFVVESETELRLRPYRATPFTRQVLQNRDIIKMFDPLTVAESFLLKSNTRETLFRRL